MEDYRPILQSRIKLLDKAISILQNRLSSSPAPEGRIRIINNHGSTQYFLVNKNTPANGRYLKTEEAETAYKIFRHSYDTKALDAAIRERALIEKLLKGSIPVEEIYGSIPEERLKGVSPIRSTDDQYIAWWYGQGTETKGVDPGAPQIFTNKGEHVRSKSEKIIADKLNELGIPYKYEHPLKLNGTKIHPDFTALNVRLRKEFYIEHLGKMDDMSYVNDAVYRLEKYERAGIYPGDSLILLHETAYRPLDTRVAEKILRKFLL